MYTYMPHTYSTVIIRVNGGLMPCPCEKFREMVEIQVYAESFVVK
jgi:hypothetical protein